jgi:cytoskeletal protein CcmA (bactofilin family)
MFKDKTSKRLAMTDTLIGQGTVLEGKLECEAGIRIEGEFRGEIVCKGDVTIGESGIARSTIEARDVTVAGKVFGAVTTNGRLTVTASGEIHGNVDAKTLVILDGAVLNGLCLMEKALPHQQAHMTMAKEHEQRTSSTGKEHKEQKDKAKQAG